MNDQGMTLYDVIIIGSGPAGLTAAIYTARADLKTLVVAGSKWGGQLMLTTLVENYPGFVDGIMGPDLMANMRKQAEKFGAEIKEEDVVGVDFGKRPFIIKTSPPACNALRSIAGRPTPLLNSGEGGYLGRAIVIATGAEFKWLGVPGEEKLIGRGVSSCATCDAAFFKDKKVVVVGGGDAAMEEALVLTKYASEVTVVHRRNEFRASKIMQERVLNNPKIKVLFNTTVEEVLGEDKVTGVRIKTSPPTPLLNSGEGSPIAVVVGHETEGVSKEVLDLADVIVEIPMWGVNKSLNVIVSAAIVVYRLVE